MKKLAFLTVALVAVLNTTAFAQAVVRDGVFADDSGRTLYIFDKDEANKSNCAGPCVGNWPLFAAPAGAVAKGDFGLIDTNGVKQWTYKSKPLYYFVKDMAAGERKGDGVNGVWHVVAP